MRLLPRHEDRGRVVTAPHPAVAAVLAVTPLLDGEVGLIAVEHFVTEYAEGEWRDPNVPDEYDGPEFGDPTPIAAAQAAAVLRWLATTPEATDGHWIDSNLAELADEIAASVQP